MNYFIMSFILVFLFGVYAIYISYIVFSKKATCKFVLNKKIFNLILFIAIFVSQGLLKLHDHSSKVIVIMYFTPPLVYSIYLVLELKNNYLISIINSSKEELIKDIADALTKMEIEYSLVERENDNGFYLDNESVVELRGERGYYSINFIKYKEIKRFKDLIVCLKSSVKHRRNKHGIKDSIVLLMIGITIILVSGYFIYLGTFK